jgi:ribonuclease G
VAAAVRRHPSRKTRMEGFSPKAGPMISELLREGQEILVQISKEPLGKKGARITSHIALPGRYLVYMPTVDHVGVSRKIASDEERSRLKRIINENRNGLPGGFIVRTAAEGRGEDEFIQDIRFLGNLWGDIRSKSEKKSAPALIHSDLNLVQRLLRDQLSPDYRAIRLDNESEFATVLDFVSKFQPALVNRVKLHLKDTPIFEEYGLNTEIEKALRSKVWLKSGGYIVINQTEALVAIDVNTGKFVGKSNRLEDTIVRTNVDAVHEIVRQIRLRNLGGIIVVDFIDMEEKKNRQRVMAALEEAVRVDRVPSKILQFNDFGLVAITRKRTQPSLERTLCRPCSYCNSSGWTKSPETICYDIQQEIKKMTHLFESKEVTVRVNPEIAKALKSGEFVSLNDLEDWTKKDIIVKSDPLLHEEHFDIF